MIGLLDRKNIWVLANYRNGSIFVCKFLEKLGGYKNKIFYERFNPLRPSTLKVYYKDSLFRGILKKWEQGDLITRRTLFFRYVIEKGLLPAKMKIMRDQFFETCGLTDKDKSLIESLIPNLLYIYIKREDIFSITISHYFALKTGRWVLKAEDRNRYLDTHIEFNENELISLYKRVRQYVQENNWDHYLRGSTSLDINFNNLVKDPVETFRKVLDYLEIDRGATDIEKLVEDYEFVPTKRPESDEYVNRLKKNIYSRGI